MFEMYVFVCFGEVGVCLFVLASTLPTSRKYDTTMFHEASKTQALTTQPQATFF